MKLSALGLVITVVNLALLSILLARGQRVEARSGLPVLRGRALQIVDDMGRVRASINVYPTNPHFKTAEGKPYPETVVLRLINSQGGPNVKLSASEEGAGLGLGGASNPTYIQLIAQGDETYVHMTNRDGQKRTLKPGKREGPPPYYSAP